MGNCTSCLGQRRRDSYDEEDEAQHLFDDPNGMHYGSFDQQQSSGQEDSQEVQREIEALQQVVARTSNNLVDIYEIEPQDKLPQASPAAHPYAHAGQEARRARYQALLTKLSSHEDLTSVTRVDWSSPEDDPIEMQKNSPTRLKLEGGDALVGNFSDAVAAMR